MQLKAHLMEQFSKLLASSMYGADYSLYGTLATFVQVVWPDDNNPIQTQVPLIYVTTTHEKALFQLDCSAVFHE